MKKLGDVEDEIIVKAINDSVEKKKLVLEMLERHYRKSNIGTIARRYNKKDNFISVGFLVDATKDGENVKETKSLTKNEKYKRWITGWRYMMCGNTSKNNFFGWCSTAVQDMKKAFPELRIVKGFCEPIGEHWWLEAEDGEIIDPTQDRPKSNYREWKPGDTVRVGTCFICGEAVYDTPPSLDGPSSKSCETPECIREKQEMLK